MSWGGGRGGVCVRGAGGYRLFNWSLDYVTECLESKLYVGVPVPLFNEIWYMAYIQGNKTHLSPSTHISYTHTNIHPHTQACTWFLAHKHTHTHRGLSWPWTFLWKPYNAGKVEVRVQRWGQIDVTLPSLWVNSSNALRLCLSYLYMREIRRLLLFCYVWLSISLSQRSLSQCLCSSSLPVYH